MPFSFLLALLVVALCAWIIHAAGPRFAMQRLAGAILVLVLVTFAVSSMLRFTTAEASTQQALEALGVSPNAQPCVTALGTGATAELVNQCVEERGLDKNVFEQYHSWVTQLVWEQDLGVASYKSGETLADTIRQRLPRTAWLFLYSQLIALLVAVPLGIWSAYQSSRNGRQLPRMLVPAGAGALALMAIFGGFRLTTMFAVAAGFAAIYSIIVGGRRADTNTNLLAFALLSIPVFVLGETLRYTFAIERDVYHLTGYAPWSAGAAAHLQSIWLPAVVLGLAASPVYLRLLRADMIQNLQQEYVSVAKAKGLSNTHILVRHVLRPSTLTLITVLGLSIAQLVNGAIVVEYIYDIDGMGSYVISAFARREFFAVQTIVALVAVLFVLTNTVIDVLYTAVDPRVKVDNKQ